MQTIKPGILLGLCLDLRMTNAHLFAIIPIHSNTTSGQTPSIPAYSIVIPQKKKHPENIKINKLNFYYDWQSINIGNLPRDANQNLSKTSMEK